MTTYVPQSTRTNLCANPSFELNTNSWQTTLATVGITGTSFAVSGSSVAQLFSAGGLSGLSTSFAPQASLSYSFSASISQDSGNSNTFALRAQVAWYDSSNNLISTSYGSPITPPFLGNTPSFSRASVTDTAPTGAVLGVASLFVTTAVAVNDAFYFDAVLIEQATSLGAYFDGNSTSIPALSNGWIGAANNSQSVQTVYSLQTTPTTYRYLFADLITNQILAELPLTSVSFNTVLNGAGTFTGTLLVTDATETYLNIWAATQPARTALYVERFSDGGKPTLIWGGVVWARDYNSTSQHITINAAEFESYFDRRKVIATSGTSGSQVYKNIDPLLLSQTLIWGAQAFPATGNSNIGVLTSGGSSTIATTATSGDGTTATITLASTHSFLVGDTVVVYGVTPTGYNGTVVLTAVGTNTVSYLNSTTGSQTVAGTVNAAVSKTYFDAELKSVLAAIQDLSHASASGFDFKIKVAYDGAFNPTKTFTTGYPRLGTAYSSTNASAPVFEFPGNVVEYTLFEDGSLTANFIYAVGVGNGQGKLNRYVYDSAQWTAGWPLLEGSTNYGDISSQSLLTHLAQGQLNAVKNPPISLKIIYPPSQDPILGSYNLGDDVRIRINDDRAGQVDDYYRVVAIAVTPGENNQGERATLTLTQKGAV